MHRSDKNVLVFFAAKYALTLAIQKFIRNGVERVIANHEQKKIVLPEPIKIDLDD